MLSDVLKIVVIDIDSKVRGIYSNIKIFLMKRKKKCLRQSLILPFSKYSSIFSFKIRFSYTMSGKLPNQTIIKAKFYENFFKS